MKQETSNLNYPSRYDIKETLSESCTRPFVEKFAQSRGIFITKATQDDLADHLSGFFYEHNDIEEIRNAAFKASSSNALSGFIITSEDKEFDLVELLDELRSNNTSLGEGINLGAIAVEELDNNSEVKGRMDYTESKPGRIEFLQKEIRSVEYTIKKIDDNSYQVFVESDKTKDAKKFESFIKKQIGKEATLETLDIEKLTSANTVIFFDGLSGQAMDASKWRFLQVKHLVVRKGDTEEESSAETLGGITRAILEGQDLRNNPFVKQCENGGYKFTAMTFEYEEKNRGFIIEIKAEFKLRPAVFEVGIRNFLKVVGTDEKREKVDHGSKEDIETKTYIWQKAREIYNTLVASNTTS